MHMKKHPDNKTTFRQLHGRKKLQYFWDYYKLPALLVCICIYIIVLGCYRHAMHKDTVLYTAFANVAVSDILSSQLTDGYLTAQSYNPDQNQIYIYKDLYLSNRPSSANLEYAYASSTKILAALDSGRLDVIFMNEEALDAMTSEGYLMKLPDSLLEASSDPSGSPYAIELSNAPLIQSAGFTEPLYIGIVANSTRTEEAISYIRYIQSDSGSDSSVGITPRPLRQSLLRA